MASENTALIVHAVGFYLGTVLAQFFQAITKDIVMPLVIGTMPGVQQQVDKYVIQVGPVKLNIGDLVATTMSLVVAYFIISFTLPYIREYSPIGGRR